MYEFYCGKFKRIQAPNGPDMEAIEVRTVKARNYKEAAAKMFGKNLIIVNPYAKNEMPRYDLYVMVHRGYAVVEKIHSIPDEVAKALVEQGISPAFYPYGVPQIDSYILYRKP